MLGGKIYAFSIINVPTEKFKGKTPYAVALVERTDGSKILTRLINFDSEKKLEIGMDVRESGTDEKGNVLFEIL